MKKEQRASVLEYVSKLTDADLRFLYLRLTERVGTDLSEALDLMSRNAEIDAVLATASTADDLFDITDQVSEVVAREAKKRKLILYPDN